MSDDVKEESVGYAAGGVVGRWGRFDRSGDSLGVDPTWATLTMGGVDSLGDLSVGYIFNSVPSARVGHSDVWTLYVASLRSSVRCFVPVFLRTTLTEFVTTDSTLG